MNLIEINNQKVKDLASKAKKREEDKKHNKNKKQTKSKIEINPEERPPCDDDKNDEVVRESYADASVSQRVSRQQRMHYVRNKMEYSRSRSLGRRHANPQVLKRRARRMALRYLRRKLTGKNYYSMGYAARNDIDHLVDRNRHVVDNLATMFYSSLAGAEAHREAGKSFHDNISHAGTRTTSPTPKGHHHKGPYKPTHSRKHNDPKTGISSWKVG